jgi:MoxR-like ATPase
MKFTKRTLAPPPFEDVPGVGKTLLARRLATLPSAPLFVLFVVPPL